MSRTTSVFFQVAFLAISMSFMAANGQEKVTSALLQCTPGDAALVVQYNPDLDACPQDWKKCCQCDNETVLFSDDFESGLLNQIKWPMSSSGRVVEDPAGVSNFSLGFSKCSESGDTFSVQLSTNTEYYRVDLDYYMPEITQEGSGYMGFSTDCPGNNNTWVLTAYQPFSQSMGILGSTSGKWKHYSFLYRVQLPGYDWMSNALQISVMLTETGTAESECGHALFDNIVVREAKVCTKSVLFYDDFECGSTDLNSQLWPKIESGYVGTDDGRNVLKFRRCSSGGDVFSASFSCPTGNYRISYDYKQTVPPSSPYNNGGFIALANGFPGQHTWLFASNPNWPGAEHNLGNNQGVWRRYSRIVSVPPGTYQFVHGGKGSSDSLRLLVENFGSKNCEAAFFDNILVECVAFGCDCL